MSLYNSITFPELTEKLHVNHTPSIPPQHVRLLKSSITNVHHYCLTTESSAVCTAILDPSYNIPKKDSGAYINHYMDMDIWTQLLFNFKKPDTKC